MPPVYLKDIFKEIRHSLGRFISIMAIVALGVAFFAGIKASAPDMKHSADTYFDQYHVQDIQIYSTIGMDEADVKAISQIKGVEDVQGQFSMDFLTRKGSSEQVVKVIGYQKDQPLNTPRLVQGRMPEAPDECLIEASGVNNELFGTYGLGDRISLYSDSGTPVSDVLDYSTYIIVGMAYSPNYLSYEKGTSTAGSGSVDTFIYVEQEAVKADYYTEIDVSVNDARAADTYSDAYFDLVDPVVTSIEDISAGRVAARTAEQQKKVDDARDEMNAELAKAQVQLDDGKAELDAGKAELDAAAAQISSGLREIQNNEALLASSKAQLDAGWAQYNAGKAELEKNEAQVNDAIAQIQAGSAQLPALQAQKDQLNQAITLLPVLTNLLTRIQAIQVQYQDALETLKAMQEANPDDPALAGLLDRIAQLEAQLDELVVQITENPNMSVEGAIQYAISARDQIIAQIGSVEQGQALLTQLNDGIAQIEEAQKQLPTLESAKAQIEEGKKELAASLTTLQNAQAQFESGSYQMQQAKNELATGQAEYESGLQEYESGLEEFNVNEEKFQEEKADAQKQIDEAQEAVDELKDGEWIVLDRNSHYSYRDYESCADRMDGISAVFPVFFYLVAALVCMTTMTRMVQEQRSEIGTLKALGYSKVQIALKYLIYAGAASLAGCVVGCLVGMSVFPYIIFTAWNTMYNLEQIHFSFQPGLIAMASLSVTAIVLLATLYSIYRELMEVPSQLMRPKAAKAGKKIMLERIPFIWNRLNFMQKVTARNLFRYKKRFFMTVVGIAGCSALLVAGFGLNDSISDIVRAQFEEIYHYNATVTADLQSDHELKEKIEAIDGVDQVLETETLSIVINFNNKDVTAYLNIMEDPDSMKPFMTFIPMMGSAKDMKLDDEGVFISIKTAEKLKLSLGDTMHFETTDGQKVEAKVSGIFDQYIQHQIYCTKTLFDSWHIKEEPSTNYLLINDSQEDQLEADIGAKVMNLDGVKSVSFYSSLQENFLNMISSIKMVVVVLVISAAMLAFVVLYNLSNVNISERMREIATIKVLGFTEKEVNQYVNRESLLLALIGGLCGLLVGIWLHSVIMSLAELDDIRFGRTILPLSFCLSMALTLLFAIGINWIMKFKLRKIEMVESLKAVE